MDSYLGKWSIFVSICAYEGMVTENTINGLQ